MDGGLHPQARHGCDVSWWRCPVWFDGLAIALSGLDAYVVGEIPRREDAHGCGAGRRVPDSGRAQRLAALVAAYHAGIAGGRLRPVAFGWVRAALAGRYGLSLAGTRSSASVETGRRRCCSRCPPGRAGRGLPLASLPGLSGISGVGGRLPGSATGCSWRTGRPGRGARGRRAGGASLDEGLLGSWTGAFGWLVIAEPVAAAELRRAGRRDGAAAADGGGVRGPVSRAGRAGAAAKERQAELQRGVSGGFWRITSRREVPTSRARRGSPGCSARPRTLAGCPTR